MRMDASDIEGQKDQARTGKPMAMLQGLPTALAGNLLFTCGGWLMGGPFNPARYTPTSYGP
jgi:hypothetical protein